MLFTEKYVSSVFELVYSHFICHKVFKVNLTCNLGTLVRLALTIALSLAVKQARHVVRKDTWLCEWSGCCVNELILILTNININSIGFDYC